MARRAALALAALAVVLVTASPAMPAEGEESEPQQRVGFAPTLFILDASGSMRATDGTERRRIDDAREALGRLAVDLPDDVEVGLRVFGHRTPPTDREASCQDTELVLPIGRLDRERFVRAANSFEPSGYTPIGLSLQEAAEDFGGELGTVVLISDGIDTCAPPDPCGVAAAITEQGLQLRVETVGFHADADARAQLECIARVTGGSYRDATDADSLRDALQAYQLRGEEVRGGMSPSQAPLLGPGTYRDEIHFGEDRWYALEPAAGEAIESDVILVSRPDYPVVDRSIALAELRRHELLGELMCHEDAVWPIGGGEVHELRLEGPTISPDEGQCASPTRYFVRVRLAVTESRDRRDAPEVPDEPVSLQLVIDFAGDREPSPTEAPAPPPPQPPPPRPEPPAPDPTPTGLRFGVGLMLGFTGFVTGSMLARRAGS